MTRLTQVPKWVFLARYWVGRTIAKYSNLWAFLQNNTTPHCGGTRKQKPILYRLLLDTLDTLKDVLINLIKMTLHKLWVSRCAYLFDKKHILLAEDIIAQIKEEVKRRISISFNSQRIEVLKQMFTWRHKDIRCTLDNNNQLVNKF